MAKLLAEATAPKTTNANATPEIAKKSVKGKRASETTDESAK